MAVGGPVGAFAQGAGPLLSPFVIDPELEKLARLIDEAKRDPVLGEIEGIETAVDRGIAVVLVLMQVRVARYGFEVRPLTGSDDFKPIGFNVYVLGGTGPGSAIGPVDQVVVPPVKDGSDQAPKGRCSRA